MSKITLEITEVVNGLTINETPITLQGDLLAAASTTATAVSFTPAGGIAATNVQAALAELDTEKLNLSGGNIDGDFVLQGDNISKSIRWDQSENLLKVSDGTTIGFGIGNALADIDLEIFHVSHQSYIRDTGAGTLFIQTDGPSITLGGTAHNNIVSGKFIPGAEVTLYHNSSAKITTTANGVDVTGLVEFDSLSGTGAVAITDILDADDMSGASATTLSTSESIKAYVDAQVSAVPVGDITAVAVDSGLTGGAVQGDVTLGIDTNIVVTKNSVQTLRDKILIEPNIDDPDIDGGTIDGTTIGATTAAAGSFTTVDSTGTVTATRADNETNFHAISTDEDVNNGPLVTLERIVSTAEAGDNLGQLNFVGRNDASTPESITYGQIFTEIKDPTNSTEGGLLEIRTVQGGAMKAGLTLFDNNGQAEVAVNGNKHDMDFRVKGSGDGNEALFMVDAANTKVGIKKGVPAHELDVNGKIQATELINTPIGTTTPSTGKFTSLLATGQVTIASTTPSLVWNDTDGNERSSIFHEGGIAYYTSIDSDETFGQHRFRRDTHSAAPINIFETFANGDVKFYEDDGTTSILKTDGVNGRVGIKTSTPKTDLQIGDSIADVGLLLAGQNSSTTSAQLLFSDNIAGDDPHEWGMGIRYDSTANALNIDDNFNNGSDPYAANNSRVTIMRDNGKVGIGTATPTGAANSLHVVGGIQGASMTVSSTVPALNLNDSDGNEQFRLSTNAGQSRIATRGVGTDYGDLSFYRSKDNGVGADPATTDTPVFKYTDTGNFIVYNDDASANAFKVTGASGNVGINTSAPGEKLDVVGTAKATQLNIRTGTSLDSVATLSNSNSLTSWKLTDQSYYTGSGEGGPASNAGLQTAPTGFFVVDNDTSANASTINGFKAFLIGSNNNDGVDEYTLGSAYNIGNMTFVNGKTGLGDNNPQDLEVHNNGQYVFVLGNNNNRLRRFTLATAYAINTLSLATSGADQIQNFSIPNTDIPTGFTFGGSGSDYGKKLYVVDSIEDTLQEFALTNAFDISSGVSVVRSISISVTSKGLVTSCTGVRFSADGTKVYLSDNAAGEDITRLNLATPWDISTTSYHEAFYVGAVDSTISGIDIAGTEIYTVDTGSDTVRQYTSNNTGLVLNADNLHLPGSIRVTNAITASGSIRVDGQLRATGGTSLAGTTIGGAFTLSNSTAAIRLGPEGATGELQVGRSTKTHTVDIHNGATESGETATVNIGTSGTSGSTTNINIGGGVGTCTTTIDGDLVIPTETPASATAAGTAGQIVWDTNYIYICTATNTWKRVAIGTW